jgi:hypothetical protein
VALKIGPQMIDVIKVSRLRPLPSLAHTGCEPCNVMPKEPVKSPSARRNIGPAAPATQGIESEKLRFPVVCPNCGEENLCHALRREITHALVSSVPICLSAPCCPYERWTASPTERDQIRQYADLPVGQFAI